MLATYDVGQHEGIPYIVSELLEGSTLRERLRAKLTSELDMCTINGSLEHRLPGNLNISFAYVEGEAMLMGLKEVAVSSGSACTSASIASSSRSSMPLWFRITSRRARMGQRAG